MNDFYSSSSVVLAHSFFTSVGIGVSFLIVMSLLVFGPLLFRKTVRMPKGLFISSFISYVLVLINILYFAFHLLIPKIILYPCFLVVFYPSFYIIYAIDFLLGSEGIFGGLNIFFLVAFIIDTLCIFAIIRLILYIKHKISVKKSQIRQGG